MTIIGYLSSYKIKDFEIFEDLKCQKNILENFAVVNGDVLDKCFEEENSSRMDLKPILLSILNVAYNNIQKIYVQNIYTISKDDEFRQWVENEFKRLGVEIVYVEQIESKKTFLSKEVAIKNRVKDIPTLPEVVGKVLQLVQDKESSAEDLARVISVDVGLMSRVLKLVNSSYYGFPRQIATIQQAITILGYTNVRGLVLSSSIYNMFKQSCKSENMIFDYKTFWKHNLLCAISAKKIARNIGCPKSDDIFSVAILHDVGKAILAQYDYSNYSKSYAMTVGCLDFEKNKYYEEKFTQTNHADIGYQVAYSWNLPEEILDVIRYHHQPKSCKKNVLFCIIVYVADIISNCVLYNLQFDINIFDMDLLHEYNINENVMFSVYEEIVDEVENINDIERFF